MCGVRITFGAPSSGLLSGSGCPSNTSSAAPAIAPDVSARYQRRRIDDRAAARVDEVMHRGASPRRTWYRASGRALVDRYMQRHPMRPAARCHRATRARAPVGLTGQPGRRGRTRGRAPQAPGTSRPPRARSDRTRRRLRSNRRSPCRAATVSRHRIAPATAGDECMCARDLTGQRKHQPQRHLGDRVRIPARRVCDHDAVLAGAFDINLVQAHFGRCRRAAAPAPHRTAPRRRSRLRRPAHRRAMSAIRRRVPPGS